MDFEGKGKLDTIRSLLYTLRMGKAANNSQRETLAELEGLTIKEITRIHKINGELGNEVTLKNREVENLKKGYDSLEWEFQKFITAAEEQEKELILLRKKNRHKTDTEKSILEIVELEKKKEKLIANPLTADSGAIKKEIKEIARMISNSKKRLFRKEGIAK